MAEFWTFIIQNVRLIGINDIIDIIIVAAVIFGVIRLVMATRAAQLVTGVVALLIASRLVEWLQLNAISYLLSQTLQVGIIAIIVMFQPELRRALEKIGNTATNAGQFFSSTDELEEIADAICESSGYMSEHKIGALIILERSTKLGDIMKTGTMLDAAISPQLITNIFMSNTPLHDGAAIISGGRIKAAACFLPLTQNNSFSKELGTRHRAAIGISEVADCISIVVSEETGKISIATDGALKRNVSLQNLKETIISALGSDDNQKLVQKSTFISRITDWMVKKK